MKNTKLYLGIGDMPIYNFDKILQTNNLSYMVVDWNERKEIEIPKDANERWEEIYNEYCKITANNDALTFYSLNCEVLYLETRFYIVSNLINGLSEINKESFGRELNAWKIPFNIKGSIKKQAEQLKRHLRIAEQNLNMKKRKRDALKNDDVEETTLLKQVIIIQEQLGVKIDIRKDSVEYFLAAIDRLKEKIKASKKVNNG